MSTAEGKKATARSRNYQDNITQPLSHDHDDNITDPDAINADLDPDTNADPAIDVFPAVERVSEAASRPFTIQTNV